MSEIIFNDGEIKTRLVKKDANWFVGEYKYVADASGPWVPWICGTAKFLNLTEKDKEWAK